ncbi:MAG TPA: hypothetical protein PLK32_08610 [Defluviitoga tunisiensis]|nr:hypothetical protein [Defluviitoga tunisiensis]HOL87401.1 hypothetical protein [Defluviitoga tunisiensis]
MNSEASTKYGSVLDYILIVSYPILSLYEGIPGISALNLGNLLLLLHILYRIIKEQLKLGFNKELLVFFLPLLILNTLSGLISFTDYNLIIVLNNNFGLIVFTIFCLYFCAPNRIYMSKLYPVLKIVAILSTAFLMIQVIFYHFFDKVILGQVPFMKSLEGGFLSMTWGRPTSFFYEPAHYSIFIAPVYVLSLLKENYYLAFFLAVGLILSTSSFGIFIAVIIPFLVLTSSLVNGKKRTRGMFFFFIFLIITSIFSLLFIEYYYPSIIISLTEDISFSAIAENPRLFGNSFAFEYFDFSQILIGVGLNRVQDFLLINNIIGYEDLFSNYNYANSFLFSIFSFGIIGFIIFTSFLVFLLKKVKGEYRTISIVFFVVLFTDQIIFNRHFLYLLVIIYSTLNEENTMVENISHNVRIDERKR